MQGRCNLRQNAAAARLGASEKRQEHHSLDVGSINWCDLDVQARGNLYQQAAGVMLCAKHSMKHFCQSLQLGRLRKMSDVRRRERLGCWWC